MLKKTYRPWTKNNRRGQIVVQDFLNRREMLIISMPKSSEENLSDINDEMFPWTNAFSCQSR